MTSLLLSALIAFASPVPADLSPVATVEAPSSRVEFRIKNDTGSSVRIHTGTGTSSIGNGSSNRYQADEGREFRVGSSSGALLFEVTSDLDGETLDLSDYM